MQPRRIMFDSQANPGNAASSIRLNRRPADRAAQPVSGSSDRRVEVQNVVDLARHRALHQPNARAYLFQRDGKIEAESLTYRELDQKARAIAAQVQRRFRPGERILLTYSSVVFTQVRSRFRHSRQTTPPICRDSPGSLPTPALPGCARTVSVSKR